MPFGWPDLLRSIVDGKYFLKQFLREDGEAGVFLADAPDNSQVDVYLAPAEAEIQRAWADRVSLSSALTHPHLLREIASGESRIDGNGYAYLVKERVQERLADVVAERVLTTDETQAVTEAVMAGLEHLHQRGYQHGKLTPASIVAASDSVKLETSTIRPLPPDELESRRAVTADLRELAETTVEMLTGKREMSAGVQLPSPFREFVRASFGTDECPSPTAAQLLGVLHGQPLTAPKRVVPEETAEPARAPVVMPPPPPPPVDEDPVRFKPGMGTVVLAGLLVLAIAFAAYRLIAGRSDTGLRTRTSDVPVVAEPVRPSPVSPSPKVAERAPASSPRGRWAVVAAAYNNYDAAARRASRLANNWKGGTVTVYPEKGQGSRYMVLLGSGASQKEAERLRDKARSSGMPRDTYITRLRF